MILCLCTYHPKAPTLHLLRPVLPSIETFALFRCRDSDFWPISIEKRTYVHLHLARQSKHDRVHLKWMSKGVREGRVG